MCVLLYTSMVDSRYLYVGRGQQCRSLGFYIHLLSFIVVVDIIIYQKYYLQILQQYNAQVTYYSDQPLHKMLILYFMGSLTTFLLKNLYCCRLFLNQVELLPLCSFVCIYHLT